MTLAYRSWEPEERDGGRVYRGYAPLERLRGTLYVTGPGSMYLTTAQELQLFGIVHTIKDPAGRPIMDETWYSIQNVQPVFDAAGFISSYRHRLAMLDAALMDDPIDPPQDYPDLDQV